MNENNLRKKLRPNIVRIIVIIAAIVVVAAILYYVLYFRKSVPLSEPIATQEENVTIEENQPEEENQLEIPLEDDQFYEFLEKNVLSGGPGKDGIPAVAAPEYTSAQEGDGWLLPEDIVFGIEYEGLLAAYPQRILVWHEIVNETLGDKDITISYCPLTGTAIGFLGNLSQDIQTTFGVSGKLVNSNLIMYDRATDSYWPRSLVQL